MNRTSLGSSDCRSGPSTAARRSHPRTLPLSKALVGFTNAKLAEGLSQRTVNSYLEDLQKWVERTGDREIDKVTGADYSAYLAWLRTEYIPHRFSGKTHPLSPKTIRNTWMAMSALFRWAERELALPFPMMEVRARYSPTFPPQLPWPPNYSWLCWSPGS